MLNKKILLSNNVLLLENDQYVIQPAQIEIIENKISKVTKINTNEYNEILKKKIV